MGFGRCRSGGMSCRHRPGRHRGGDHAVSRGPYPRRAAGPGGAPAALRCHALLHVRRRGDASDADRQIQHGRRSHRRLGDAEAPARQAGGKGRLEARIIRAGSDEDAAPASGAAALHSGNGAGCACLFPVPAILAGRLRRQHRQFAAHARGSLRRWASPAPARHKGGRGAKALSGCRPVPSAGQWPGGRKARSTAVRSARYKRNGGRAADARLCALQQFRPLRRRHRSAGGAGPACDPGFRQWPRSTSGDRTVLPARRCAHGGRCRFTDRFFPRRRPRL